MGTLTPLRSAKKLIAFATQLEAEPAIVLLKAKKLAIFPNIDCFEFESGWIIISGIGCLQANHSVSQSLHFFKPNTIWNVGVAGALQENMLIGSTFWIMTISKHFSFPKDIDEHSKLFGFQFHPPFTTECLPDLQPHIHLLSSDFPIHNASLKKDLSQSYDLVDMEGYGIAFAAKKNSIPFQCLKGVTDFSKENGHQDIKRNIKNVSEILASRVLEHLKF